MQKVATATMSACIYQTEVRTARIRNFEKVARGRGEAHEGIFYDDSDVFKPLEAMAYVLRWSNYFASPMNAGISTSPTGIAGEPVLAIKGEVPALEVSADGRSAQTIRKEMIAIPYYTWCNRGSNEMQVWLPRQIRLVKINPAR